MRGTATILAELPGGRTGAARLVDGRLDDLLIDPPADDPTPRPEAIHRAMIGRPVKGLGGAFVELGGGQRGFLRDTRGLAPGQTALVQVASWAEPGKAPPVTRRLLLKGRLAILTPDAPGLNLSRTIPDAERPRLEALAARAMTGADPALGLVLRTAALDSDDDAIAAEIAELRRRLAALAPDGEPACLQPAPTAAEEAARDWPHDAPPAPPAPSAFRDHHVWDEIDSLRTPLVPLPGGGSLAVEATRALVAVDVNTGSDTAPAASLKANIAAMRELPRQLRLRGLGGIVVVDLAPLAKPDRGRIAETLKAALARDAVATTIAGWTPLGALELSRRRLRRPLTDLLAGLDEA